MSQKEIEQLHRMLSGAALTRAICSVAEFGVADHIETGKPQPVEYLAKASKTHAASLYRTLRFLASYGVFHETANRHFDHTPLSAILRTDATDSARAGAQMYHHLFAGWDGLHHSIETGEPGFNKVFGTPIFDYIRAHPQMGPIFDAGMTSLHGYEVTSILDAYKFEGINVLADIGGGNGSFLIAALGRHPKLKGMLFDLGHVIGRAKGRLASAGLADRCTVIEGSFFETIPSGADAYHFKHIIHDWTDAQCGQILGHCRKVIPANGKLVLSEAIVRTDNAHSQAKDLDMTMMIFPGGQERTEAEFRSLLKANGFETVSITPTTSLIHVIEARPA